MWAVVPVKQLAQSKQRLADVLSQPQRAALMLAMIEDVLAALARVRGLNGRLLVTRDERLHALAARYGANVLCEDEQLSNASREENGAPENGLCRALDEATAYLRARDARGMLIVPGDVPLIDASEIEALLAAHRGVTIVPDRNSSGTNALLLTPPGSIGFRFGVDSCRRHEQAARDAGLKPQVTRVASLALDVDTIEDLSQLRTRGRGTQAHAVLATFVEGMNANGFGTAHGAPNGNAQ